VLSTPGHDACTDIGFPRVVDRANRTTSRLHHHFRTSQNSLFRLRGQDKPGKPQIARRTEKTRSPFHEAVAKLILADGRAENKLIQTVMVPVTLKGRTFTTPFVCTEGGPEAATLLGVDFARLAKLVVNYHNDTYHFHDASYEEYAFVRKETHPALPLNPFNAVQPEPMEESVQDDPYRSPIVFDELMKSDEWFDLTRDYGPILSPLPPTPPRVVPPTIHVHPRPLHGPTETRNFSRTGYQWADATYAVDLEYEDSPPGGGDLFPSISFATLDLRAPDEGKGNALSSDEHHQPNVMLHHYGNLFAEHRATTPILKQADRPLVYTHRPNAGNHAIGAALLQGEKPNRRKTRNMKPQLPGKLPPRRKPPPARKRSPPEELIISLQNPTSFRLMVLRGRL
jgi:hypothetical protein